MMDNLRPVLTACDVHRKYSTPEAELHVLKGINLQIRPGEMVAVTGESGVGKSTLLHIMGGLDRPTSGQVKIGDADLAPKSEMELANLRNEKVGFVFQFHYLLEDFTALENVMIPLLIARRNSSQAASRAEHLLEQVGLRDRMTHRPRQLSGGEQQRVAVARSLANETEIVLADEPSGNLDIATGRKLHELLFELNRVNRTTFLIATHNRELAGQCHREMEIIDGKAVERRAH
jgi:lipoprotein-releasing system ATP-binding protein